MTAQEMYDSFILLYDVNGSYAAAGFEEDEVISFLNKAQEDVVKNLFVSQGPESIPELIDYQIEVLEEVSGAFFYNNVYKTKNGKPDDYFFYIDSRANILRGDVPGGVSWVNCDIIEEDDVNKFVTNGLNSPRLYRPVVYLSGGNVSLVIDGDSSLETDTVDVGGTIYDANFVLTYLRTPKEIALNPSSDSEINERWHQEIVNMAVNDAMAVTNDIRVKQRIVNQKSNDSKGNG